jgi:hypothetical protein
MENMFARMCLAWRADTSSWYAGMSEGDVVTSAALRLHEDPYLVAVSS